MNANLTASICHQLKFASLRGSEEALTFPCSAKGEVDMDALDHRDLYSYLYARAVVGRSLAEPVVETLCT